MIRKISYPDFLKDEESVYGWLCIGIVYSTVFWTLLNSILIILLFLYWLFFSKKTFDLSSNKTRLLILFGSLYIICLIGLVYTNNLPEGFFRLQQKSALLAFPLIFGSTRISERALRNLRLHFVMATCMSCLISLAVGLARYSGTHKAELLNKEQLMIFPDMNPPITGLFCLLSIVFLLNHLYRHKTRKILIIT